MVQKIVAGRLGGRKLLNLPRTVQGVRPSSSRVRSAIFDRLQSKVVDAKVLDLFAGSGALAIEALSRGATRATFVEKQSRVIKFLEKQLDALNLSAKSEIICSDCLKFLHHPTIGGQYHLVLIDPPYAEIGLYSDVLKALIHGQWLAKDHVVVCEYGLKAKNTEQWWPSNLNGWVVDAERRHGDTALLFMHHRE